MKSVCEGREGQKQVIFFYTRLENILMHSFSKKVHKSIPQMTTYSNRKYHKVQVFCSRII